MSEAKPEKKGIIAKIAKIKHIEIYLAVLLGVVLFLIYFSSFTPKSTDDVQTDALNYEDKLKADLLAAVSAVKGVGNVKVLITFESSTELIIAYTITQNGDNKSSTPQIVQRSGSQYPIVTKEIYPKITGILIVAEGADNTRVKVDIMQAVMIVFKLDSNSICVLAGK